MIKTLPPITTITDLHPDESRLLIISEGFEDRSLSYLNNIASKQGIFSHVILCKNIPERKSKIKKLQKILHEGFLLEEKNIKILNFERSKPILFEESFKTHCTEIEINTYNEIIIDISVMSKLMIVMLTWLLRTFSKKIKFIYTEPVSYAPRQKDYKKLADKTLNSSLGIFPSMGVQEVVRTPELSSIVMQQNPNLMLAFSSFNEHLIRAMMSTFSPSHFFLIGSVPPSLSWREMATQKIHEGIISEFPQDNKKDSDGKLLNRTSTLDYRETFELIAEFYNKYCYDYRFIIAPTGSKMQSLGVGLIKCCCHDIHIEYPTPHSFLWSGYSSKKIKTIHQVEFENFCKNIKNIAEENHLNG